MARCFACARAALAQRRSGAVKLCSVQAQLSSGTIAAEPLLRHSEYHRVHGEAGAAARKHGIKQAQPIARERLM